MKLHDIAMHGPNREAQIYTSPEFAEVIELLKARHADSLFNCTLLAGDELELASYVIAKVYADPCYEPSMTLLQAIRTINAKLALCGTASAGIPNFNRGP
jgi:hypothetical protein